LAKRSLVLAAVLLVLACSSEPIDEETDDDARIVPRGLEVTALAGGNGVLKLVALTLRKGPMSSELYAAVANDGDVPACHAALAVDLFDHAEQPLASGISGLLTRRFYRLTDGSGAIAACVGPGDVTMAAVTDLPADLAIEDVGHVVYRCPYFALDVMPIDGLAIAQVEHVTTRGGTAFAGTFVNGLDVVVDEPSVAVFPVNRVGRPLGVATDSGTALIPPGGRWTFETNAVDIPGVDHVAYPSGALAN
jgi:hypothetical protein